MQSIRSTLLLLAAGFAAVKAQNGADISGGDAACPIEEPFRVSTNPDSWWYNICTSYGASWVCYSSLHPFKCFPFRL